MNLYRYRVVERTITTIIAGNSTEGIEYYVQKSLLGIMWADMFKHNGISYYSYRTKEDAITACDSFSAKEITKDKVVHPIKQTK
jgi:hypothetical protein